MGSARIKSNAFIQNIHHFRDDNLRSDQPPTEKVVVFDEAQRAWTNEAVSSFMKRKKTFSINEEQYETQFWLIVHVLVLLELIAARQEQWNMIVISMSSDG